MRHLLAVLSLALILSACAAPRPAAVVPPAVVAPTPRPAPVAAVPLSSDWNDWPYTPGDWRYLRQPAATASRFDGANGVTVSLVCDRFTRRLRLTGLAAGPVTLRTTAATRGLAPVAGEATLAATDPLLDAIAFSRGRFVIEQAGRAPLVLPPYAEIGRVIEDCRG